jgi:hypothetical protein
MKVNLQNYKIIINIFTNWLVLIRTQTTVMRVP